MHRASGVAAGLVLAATAVAGAQSAPDWVAFDRYVAQAARDWRVPAFAIAIVKDDSLVFAKGYGVLEVGTTRRADEHTRFAIGSTTKAMTSAGLAMLVDEGKLRWDDRVTTYIPELQLSDPWVTRELTIRDLAHPPHRAARNGPAVGGRVAVHDSRRSFAAFGSSSRPPPFGQNGSITTSCIRSAERSSSASRECRGTRLSGHGSSRRLA